MPVARRLARLAMAPESRPEADPTELIHAPARDAAGRSDSTTLTVVER